MMIHDLIKIELTKQGYLPNYPYHLISDKEMFDAFLDVNVVKANQFAVTSDLNMNWTVPTKTYLDEVYGLYDFEGAVELFWDEVPGAKYTVYVNDEIAKGPDGTLIEFHPVNQAMLSFLKTKTVKVVALVDGEEVSSGSAIVTEGKVGSNRYVEGCYFTDKYPCTDESLRDEYNQLVEDIKYHIDTYLLSSSVSETIDIPDWVYSYMLGNVISVDSSQLDRHDLLVLLNLDNLEDELTVEVMKSCLDISRNWIRKLTQDEKIHRPPTMFGEPHIIKSLRLSQVDTLY